METRFMGWSLEKCSDIWFIDTKNKTIYILEFIDAKKKTQFTSQYYLTSILLFMQIGIHLLASLRL